LFIVHDNVKVYGLGTGKQIHELRLPSGNEAPSTVGIQYDPVQDRVYLKMRSGINSAIDYRTLWRAYNGTTGQFITTFNPDKRDVEGITIVPEANRVYLAYSGASEWERGLKTYDLGSVELDNIKGLYGQLTGSRDDQYLFVLRPSGVWALERETLNLVALWPLSELYEQMVIDQQNEWLYLRRDAQIAALSVQDLLDKGIQSPKRLPETIGLPASTYRSPLYESDGTIYAIVPSEGVYRSDDRGQTWVLHIRGLKDLYVTELTFSDNFAQDGLLWVKTSNQSTYSSTDRGETWQRVFAWSPGIYIMNSDGSQVRALTGPGINGQHPSWDPEDKWICFDSNHEGSSEIYVVQSDGYGLARLTDDPMDDTQPAWSPVGERIAFVSMRDGNPEIYVMSIDGANPIRLTDNPANDRQPCWSPDGTRLAFTSDREGQDDIYLLTLASGEVVRLTTGDSQDSQPAWSPDNQWIAFVSDQHSDLDIYRIRPDGTEQIQVTSASASEQYPAWSPDSSTLVFASDRTGTFQLYRMNLFGGDWRRLTTDTYTNITPAWIHS
jgi:Tol biopolymer transport system component